MSYTLIEAGLLTVIRLHASYDTTNSSRGDYRLLAGGLSRYAIITYGGHARRELTLKLESVIWDILIDLFIPWRGEQTTLDTDFLTERQILIDQVAKYPTLNGVAGVKSAMIATGEEPELLTPVNSAYRGQRLHCLVEEYIDPNRAE